MGLRGPLPTPARLRSVRGGRKRAAAAGLNAAIEAALMTRADELDRLGRKMLKRAERSPLVTTPSNGKQASPLFAAAHKLFEAADRIYLRIGRLSPGAEEGGESPGGDADPLEAFHRAKH